MYDCIKIDMASFEDPEAAEKAVEALNGNDNAGKIIYVRCDQKEIERQAELKEKFERIRMERINRYQGVNLYVKNLADNIDDERLRKEFAQFGTITSAKVMTTEDGRSKGFGFVCFRSPEEAAKAIVEMNEKLIEARPLYVALAQKKQDRKAQLASQYMQRTSSRDMPEHRIGPGVNLFIKNLDKSIDDEKLREEFSQFGTITSAKVKTKNDKSKGFGFVSFSSPEEASTAISEMHGRIVVDKPLYVALAQRKEDRRAHLALLNRQNNTSMDKQGEQRELGVNVYVKNLDDNIDDERLREEFAQFGTITSAKVMTEDGLSKKFGFVCFSSPEEASKAIEKMNGRIVVAKPLYVALAQKKEDREAHLALLNMQDNTSMDRQGEQRELGVNVYVKNLDDNIDDERLREEFAQFGTITSAKVMTEDGLSKKFGFVCFSSPEEASKAIEKMNGRIVVAKPLYVALAQKKEDREAHLALLNMQDNTSMDRQGEQRELGVNVYVKNLDDNIDDERLREEFAQFGTITSAKVMTEDGMSKKFGFVCFSSPEEASKAIEKMNGRIVVAKPLYVALAQKKEDREAHLASQYMQRMRKLQGQQIGLVSQMFQPGSAGYFVPTMPQAQRTYFTPNNMPAMRSNPRWRTTVRPTGQPGSD